MLKSYKTNGLSLKNTPPTIQDQKRLKVDVMDERSERFICTLCYPAPINPLFPVSPLELVEWIFLQRPYLRLKAFTLYVGEDVLIFRPRKIC